MATDPKILERNREWWRKNSAAIAEKRRKRYAENPEKIRQSATEYYYRNREKRIEAITEYRRSNPEKIRQQHREHYKRNPERRRAFSHIQRGKRKGVPGKFTVDQVRELLLKQKQKCVVCRKRLDRYHIDHIMPIAKGGTNHIENIQLLCGPCNQRKSDKDPIVFMQQQGFLF